MPHVNTTICPIWIRSDRGYDLIGTSVLCAFGEETFLISAAHVLDFGNNQELFVGTEAGYLPITEKATVTNLNGKERTDDHVDIGFIQISSHTASHLFPAYGRLPPDWFSVDAKTTDERLYRVSGCPHRKVLQSGRSFYPKLYSLNLASYPNAEYEKLGLNSHSHIVLEFDPKRMTNEAKQKVHAPKLHGMSGGPVWQFEDVIVDGQPGRQLRLAGIVIEHRQSKKAVVSTRIIAPLEAIRSRHPDLSDLIPRNPHMDVYCRWKD